MVLQESVLDIWTWQHDQGDEYSIKVAYKKLSDDSSVEVNPLFDNTRNKLYLSKYLYLCGSFQ